MEKKISFKVWMLLFAFAAGCQFDLGGDLGGGSPAGRLVFTNAADFRAAVTPGSFATAWGAGLKDTKMLRFSYAEIQGLPQTKLEIAPTLAVDSQINFVIPAMNLPIAMGATVEALDGAGNVIDHGWITLSSAAPALFVDGKGLPAGYALGRKNLPENKYEDSVINYFRPDLTEFVPIQQSSDELYLILYGEGGQPASRSSMSDGQVTYSCASEKESKAIVNDKVEMPVLSWGPSSWAGVDQINLRVTGLIPQIVASGAASGIHTLKLMVRDCFGDWKETQSTKLRFASGS